MSDDTRATLAERIRALLPTEPPAPNTPLSIYVEMHPDMREAIADVVEAATEAAHEDTYTYPSCEWGGDPCNDCWGCRLRAALQRLKEQTDE